jgi:hypothetical protein
LRYISVFLGISVNIFSLIPTVDVDFYRRYPKFKFVPKPGTLAPIFVLSQLIK